MQILQLWLEFPATRILIQFWRLFNVESTLLTDEHLNQNRLNSNSWISPTGLLRCCRSSWNRMVMLHPISTFVFRWRCSKQWASGVCCMWISYVWPGLMSAGFGSVMAVCFIGCRADVNAASCLILAMLRGSKMFGFSIIFTWTGRFEFNSRVLSSLSLMRTHAQTNLPNKTALFVEKIVVSMSSTDLCPIANEPSSSIGR